MPIDPIAGLTRLEALRRSGIPIGPELLSDGLEGAATPLDADPMAGEAVAPAPDDNAELFARQEARAKTDDYRRERALYRVAKATGTPVEELMQQPEWAGVGEARADSAIVPMQARAAMAQKRMDGEAERMDRWKSQMLLASSNSRANMSNAFGMLSPEQQQRVIESRLTGNRYNNNNDPRMAIAQLEAETRRAEGQDARASAAEIAEANRVAAREQRQAELTSEELKYKARSAEEKMRTDMAMQKMDQQHALLVKQLENGQTAAAQDTALKIKGLEVQLATATAATQSRSETDKYVADQRLKEAEVVAGNQAAKLVAETTARETGMKLMQQKQRETEAMSLAGPGGIDLVQGQYGTPNAQESLDAIAARSDKSWLGFTTEDAKRMDAVLIRLGITDPAVRKELVTRHGVGVEAPGQRARGSAHSRMWYPHPEYAPVPTAE